VTRILPQERGRREKKASYFGDDEDDGGGGGGTASRAEIIKFLVKECHLNYEQIANLNDVQVKTLCARDRPGPGQF